MPIRWETKDSIIIYSVTMANSSWKDDEKLKKDLDQYVRENLKRSEILDFVKRDFPEHAGSIATLDRRLRHFEIRYIDYNTSVEAISAAASQELNGPGKLLGYTKSLEQYIMLKYPGIWSTTFLPN